MRIGLLLSVSTAVLLGAAPAPSRPLPRATLHRILTGTEITVEYGQTPAREVFKHLQTVLGIPLRGRYSDDRVGHGIDPDTPITLAAEDPVRIQNLEFVQDLVDLIERTVEPDSWEVAGGPATISYLSGTLIIRAPDFVHRRLSGH